MSDTPEIDPELHPNWSVQDETTKCPHCNAPNNAWSSTDGTDIERPRAGAISLCFMCGGLCVYLDERTMRQATAEELATWESDPMVVRTRKILSYTDSPNLASSLLLMTP